VFDAAERARRVMSEAFMWRHLPATRRAMELVHAGSIGELRRIRAAFSFVVTNPADIRLSSELEGGSLMDIGCYCVSAARLFAGEPVEASARSIPAPSGVDMRMESELRFANGVVADFESALDQPERKQLELIGTEGTIRFRDPWHGSRPGLDLERDGSVESIDLPAADPYALELKDVAIAVSEGRSPLLGRDDALGQARAIEALLRSAANGAPTRLGRA
jgi:predicted dehydrogenase